MSSEAVTEKTSKPDTSATIAKSETEPTKPEQSEKNNTSVASTTADRRSKSAAAAENKGALEKPFVSRLSEEQTATAYKATFLEQYNYTTDTINIVILKEPSAPVANTSEPSINNNSTAPSTAPITTTDLGKQSQPAVSSATISPTKKDSMTKRSSIVMMNSDCKGVASDNDVDKLRVRIIAEKSSDDKLGAAKKLFRNKCLSVKQVLALSELFPTEELKYRFLDLSYAFTSDSGNYYLLEQALNEEYYKNRFRAMIHK
jgi:hypothetical protein